MEITWLILDVSTHALIVSAINDFAHQGVLHSDAGQFAHISGCGFVVFVGQTVGVRVVGRFQAKGASVSVHFLKEIFHRLIRLKPTLVVIG